MLPAAIKREVSILSERLQHIFRTLRHGGILLLRPEDDSTSRLAFPVLCALPNAAVYMWMWLMPQTQAMLTEVPSELDALLIRRSYVRAANVSFSFTHA
jgi:hypothetical protein